MQLAVIGVRERGHTTVDLDVHPWAVQRWTVIGAINARRPVFRDLRGEGVWLGCELADPWRGKAFAVMQAAGEAGLLVLMAGPDVVRLAPSLVISLDEILEGLARLESALNRALA